jgi:3-methylfumaryl-CoA hydratase
MTASLDHLREWIGTKERTTDVATAWPVAALAATLDRRDPAPASGDPLPAGWHWLYFRDSTPASELGFDGLPKRGGFLPPVTLPRRMWAGGRIAFRRAIKIGETLARESAIIAVDLKHGKSGSLVFVTVRHTVSCAEHVAVVEEHDIVYREAAKPGEPPPQGKPAPPRAAWRREVIADPVMLFRYSALIFNANRIHYDMDYCREQGYPGLVVHGPLQSLLLLDLCRRNDARLVKRFDYRAIHPVFHTERFTVNGEADADGSKAELWTANAAGNRAMAGTAYF